MKKIKKSIDIKASAEKVWNVMLSDETYTIWTSAFSEGSIAETDWKLGSKVVFKDKSNSGIFGKISKKVPYKIFEIVYDGMVVNDKEDYESAEAKSMKGVVETYTFSEKDGVTHVAIECDMDEKYFDMMSAAWDKALLKVKELAEKA